MFYLDTLLLNPLFLIFTKSIGVEVTQGLFSSGDLISEEPLMDLSSLIRFLLLWYYMLDDTYGS